MGILKKKKQEDTTALGAGMTGIAFKQIFGDKGCMCIIVNGDGIPVAYSPLRKENIPSFPEIYKRGDTMRIAFDIKISPANDFWEPDEK